MDSESLRKKIRDSKFNSVIKSRGGTIYIVGGYVRDQILGKPSKDYDLVVTGISAIELEVSLSDLGKVDLVGKSFGIYKFKYDDVEFDVALPRRDKKTGDTHTDFEIDAGPHVTLLEDLERRDFTMNAIAMDLYSDTMISLPGYCNDLQDNILRLCNPEGFADDPLRMLRCIQFASRFGSTIAIETLDSLIENSYLIKTVSAERIIIEFEKMVNKGDPEYGMQLLLNTGLHHKMVGNPHSVPNVNGFMNPGYINTLAEFIVYFVNNNAPYSFFRTELKGDVETGRQIKALNKLAELNNTHDSLKKQLIIFEALQHSSCIMDTMLFETKSSSLRHYVVSYMKSNYPKSIREIDCTGDAIMALGFKGPAIGEAIKKVLRAILDNIIKNKRQEILEFLVAMPK